MNVQRKQHKAVALGLALLATWAQAGDVVVNGGFDDKSEPLKGWNTDFRWTGKEIFSNNHRFVDVLSKDGGRKNILRIRVPAETIARQGVMVESDPIPFDPESRYTLAVDARTTGPDCRVFLEGYRKKRGTRKDRTPNLSELRKVFRQAAGRMVYFGSAKSGNTSAPTKNWSTGKAEIFPQKELSKLAQEHVGNIEYLVIHILGIFGTEGDILIDKIALNKQ